MRRTIETTYCGDRHFVGARRVVKAEQIRVLCAEVLPLTLRWLQEQGVEPDSPPSTLYHHVNRDAGEFDIQPGFFVAEPIQGAGDIDSARTTASEFLTATHVGPYETIGETWHALFDQAAAMGRPVTKSSWEIYLDDPGCVPAEDLRTQIYVPIDPVVRA